MKHAQNARLTVALVLLLLAPLACSREPRQEQLSSAVFVIKPYLQQPTARTVTLMWTCDQETADALVRYGPGQALDRQANNCAVGKVTFKSSAIRDQAARARSPDLTEYVYQITLADLQPDTLYAYEVTVGQQKAGGSFRTLSADRAIVPSADQPTGGDGADPPGFTDAARPIRFVAYGDSRSNPAKHRVVAQAIAQTQPDFILHTGDLVFSGQYDQYKRDFFDPLEGLVNRVPVWPVAGNHEGNLSSYRRLFALPNNERWYSFDYGNIHFVALDTNVWSERTVARRAERSANNNEPDDEPDESKAWEQEQSRAEKEMLRWAEADLAASRATWKIVYLHEPMYDLGSHLSGWGRAKFAPLFRKYGVDLVVAGHSHTYQRFRPMFTPGQNDRHPITHLVAAGGGASLYWAESNPQSAVTCSEYHYVLFTVSGHTLQARALTPDGAELDAFQIVKDRQGRPDPAYLAQAMDETRFGALRALLAEHLGKVALDARPKTGRPIVFSVRIGAGPNRLAYTLRLAPPYTKNYRMEPISGQAPPNQTDKVTVTIHPKGKCDAVRNPATRELFVEPELRLFCDADIDGQKVTMYSGKFKVK